MKAISIGKRYEIYDDSLKAYDRLPAKTYTVRFEKMSGFFLETRTDLAVKEKVYGIHPEKADKVFQAFTKFERNLGVILSGDNWEIPFCPDTGVKGSGRWISCHHY